LFDQPGDRQCKLCKARQCASYRREGWMWACRHP